MVVFLQQKVPTASAASLVNAAYDAQARSQQHRCRRPLRLLQTCCTCLFVPPLNHIKEPDFQASSSSTTPSTHIYTTSSHSNPLPGLPLFIHSFKMQFATLAVSALALAASAVTAAPAQKRAGGSGQATYFYQVRRP